MLENQFHSIKKMFMEKGRSIFLAGTVLLLGILAIYQYQTNLLTQIRLGYAKEQIKIFQAMVEQSRNTENTKIIKANKRYLVEYYPSGTKQKKGTILDELVEENRQFAIDQIEFILKSNGGDQRE